MKSKLTELKKKLECSEIETQKLRRANLADIEKYEGKIAELTETAQCQEDTIKKQVN